MRTFSHLKWFLIFLLRTYYDDVAASPESITPLGEVEKRLDKYDYKSNSTFRMNCAVEVVI